MVLVRKEGGKRWDIFGLMEALTVKLTSLKYYRPLACLKKDSDFTALIVCRIPTM